jgi:hypothetical protein
MEKDMKDIGLVEFRACLYDTFSGILLRMKTLEPVVKKLPK